MKELANIEADEIVIRVPIATIQHAASAVLWEMDLKITDERKAAEAIVRYLNDEDEEGSTPVHFALDKALLLAVENGEEGFEDAASVDGRRMAETENTDSVPQGTTSAVANGETPNPSPVTGEGQGWQPIETLPEGEWVLVFIPSEDEHMGRVHAARNMAIVNGHSLVVGHHFAGDLAGKPSHWRPLPEPPEQPEVT